jgi:hypothetical protein
METNKAQNITPVEVKPVTTVETQPKPEDTKVQIQLGNTDVLKIKMLEKLIQQQDIIIKQLDQLISFSKPK